MGRHARWILAITTLLVAGAAIAIATALALLRVEPQAAWEEFRSRSPGEIVRYLALRLQGHDKLEWILLPPLHWVQRMVERPVQLQAVPTLGKGPDPAAVWGRRGMDGTSFTARLVDSTEGLRQAVAEATAGQTILIAPGSYRIVRRLETRNDGEASLPILVRPLRPDTVVLEVATPVGMRISNPHWQVVGLSWRGVCPAHDHCEHAIHVVGRALSTVISDHRMSDFNAHIKINGEEGAFPDDGRILRNLLSNAQPRKTPRPVSAIDAVAVSGWIVADNVIANIVKSAGNQVSYMAMMKGAGRGGRFERNLAICTMSDISQPGRRVGLSFGGGGTGPAYCRDQRCDTEFEDGLVQDNIVAHCNDAGVDVNTALRTLVQGNTLINTAGVQLRGEPSTAVVRGNLMDGDVRHRPGSSVESGGNEIGDSTNWFADADALDLRWASLPGAERSGRTEPDFCGRPRAYGSPAGALSSAGPCGR